MKNVFIDNPKPIESKTYDLAINEMCKKIARIEGVRSIYQIGGISTPGISDIDLVAVFDDGVCTSTNVKAKLSKVDRYLFTHGIYGAVVSSFLRAREVSLFHNFVLLSGEDLRTQWHELNDDQEEMLKTQIALEFLLKMYINMVVQRTYRIFKLRGVFLHINAILYDLEFLGTTQGDLFDLTNEIVSIRRNWFKHPVPEIRLNALLEEFFEALSDYLETKMATVKFYLPDQNKYQVAANMTLEKATNLNWKHQGIVLPSRMGKFSRKTINLQHRFNQFVFEVPFSNTKIPAFLDNRFNLIRELKQQKARQLQHFAVMTSSLNLL